MRGEQYPLPEGFLRKNTALKEQYDFPVDAFRRMEYNFPTY